MTSRFALRTRKNRGALALLVFVGGLVFAPWANAQSTPRAKALAQKLMCICGCNQILGACNHVGCKYSHDMLAELDQYVGRNESDGLILQNFVQEYGPTVLSEPPASGFNWAAWIVPIVAPLIAIFFVWALVRRWRQRAVLSTAGGPQVADEFLARAKDESSRNSDE